ncbi:hypothetical protein ACIP5Y_30780 [Nocardia sp. NPDC088792]|uniref:hypothetical protein n=1 Tax=Nocardia sp. NPDC088792 TaxID=3364332 RepID=UPI0037FD3C23
MTTSEPDSGATPEAPPMDPETEPIPFTETPQAQQHSKDWAETFELRRRAGVERAQKIAEAAAALKIPLSALASKNRENRNDQALEIFDTAYTTQRVSHTDTRTGMTWSHKTRWNKAADQTSYYLNTPQPSQNRIFSWQLQREPGEPLRVSDIFYLQYLRGSTQPNQLQPLRYIRQQQAYSESIQPVYDHLRYTNPKNDGSVPSTTYPAGSATYFALLGTSNGAGPAYLVIDWARELGITGIGAIEVDRDLNLYFHFSQ